ncbi:putative Fe(3+)-transporting ATPase [Megalodesulfovibrio gigas DSM 1382 = ATCC 19364]|uniref:Putative Fe(3+)-transporting ATPase n=2 Tax=Megalodesulfovibrio gigas TaxID=879 RepID=T2GDG9_MEGG1|nr:putative Fe(3+)-transporting ATPase [Megalodesulfovibrio gigas DSM 1382 = ATCC 19364]
MFLQVDGLGKRFGVSSGQQSLEALHDVSFTVQAGEILSFIGPSGAGKTTLLKCIAGLEHPDAGTLAFASPPSKAHPVILVFQDFLLFPHLTVFENVAFGLRARRLPRAEILEKVRGMLGYFGLEDKQHAYPAHLSAGQKQRTAIARAMVVEPALLLLDEPFANLDRNLKLQTARFIRTTQKRFGVTTISVTHDLEEAFAMSDRLGLMLDGQLVQCGTARELYHAPATAEAAAFLGPVNIVPGRLLQQLGLTAGQDGPLLVRPESLHLTPDPNGPGVIAEAEFAGHYWKYQVTAFGLELSVYSQANGLSPGNRVSITLAASEFPMEQAS